MPSWTPISLMLVVSDTSPLSNLAIIGRLPLLMEQCAEVRMPPAVARKLAVLESTPGQAALAEAVQAGWLKEISSWTGLSKRGRLGWVANDPDRGRTRFEVHVKT
jgi:hypothetical protein